MIRLGPNKFLVQSESELPNLDSCIELFADFETTSFDPKQEAFYAYRGHRIAGIAVTWDDHSSAYYVPIRHRGSISNVPLEPVIKWLRAAVSPTRRKWINHNVKFDAHFAKADGVDFLCELVDTLTLCKTLDTDRFTHELKPLCREWCDMPMEGQHKLDAWLRGAKTKDFGDVPADICGEYACEDVLGNRELWRYLVRNKPAQLDRVWSMETRLTPVFYDMEQRGMQVNTTALKLETWTSAVSMLQIQDRMREITGQEYVNSPAGKFELLVTQYGLPIVARTEAGNASFDKDALKVYRGLPEVVTSYELSELVSLMLEYSKQATFKSLFCDSWPDKMTDGGVLHPRYNQLIRTSRTSCSDPNSQQFNDRAKKMIQPRDGYALLVGDAAQIEFRGIVHYIEDEDAIAAYERDPDMDFHLWVSELCHMERDPAKTVNFSIGYGAGRRNVTGQLMSDPSVMKEVQAQVQDEIERGMTAHADRANRYHELCARRANEIYDTYHDTFPGIRKYSRLAAKTAETRGYVYNEFGRRRHVPANRSQIAFNSVIQSWAGDVIKERMLALSPRYCQWLRDNDTHLILNVHDELGWEGPREFIMDPAIQARFREVLCETELKFRVPIRWSVGVSSVSWSEAKEADKKKVKASASK